MTKASLDEIIKWLRDMEERGWRIETYHGEGSMIYNNPKLRRKLKDDEYAYTIIFKEKI